MQKQTYQNHSSFRDVIVARRGRSNQLKGTLKRNDIIYKMSVRSTLFQQENLSWSHTQIKNT